MKKINDEVYYVGVLNPNLRVFDIIMQTEYGTSYNSYLIKGEKNILVECVHERYFEEYIKNIEEIVEISKIDYIVINHTELDHTGALTKLLELNPKIEVISSSVGAMYLKNILNKGFNSIVVKDGEEKEIGDLKVKFLVSPFLHWPDSMFTYIEKYNMIFTCDFLGTHYCEPYCFDYNIKYKNKYEESLKYYFDVIFGPFKEHVLKGLEKIKDLKMDYVCTSHGPVLTQHSIKNIISNYYKWSEKEFIKNKIISIFYVSSYGCTKKMADKIAEGIKAGNPSLTVNAYNIIEYDISKLKEIFEESTAVLIGSPTINKDAVKPVWDLLSVTDAIVNRGKKCAVFGSFGWSGEGIKALENKLLGLGLNLIQDSIKINFMPSEEEQIKCREFGMEFAKSC